MKQQQRPTGDDIWLVPLGTPVNIPVPGAGASGLPIPVGIAKSAGNQVSPIADELLPDGIDVRNLSPRQMSELSLDLYINGIVLWDEYALIAFQPELHPAFNETIGALTGERALPDQGRDYIALWNKRLEFEQRHNSGNIPRIIRIRNIIRILRRIPKPKRLV